MNRKKVVAGFISVILASWLVLGAAGCKSEPLPVPPPPQISEINPAVPTTETPSAIEKTAPPSTPSPVTTLPESPAVETSLRIESNSATIAFPDKITFSLKGSSPVAVKTISLEYGTDERSLTDKTTRTEVEFNEAKEVLVSWDWQMKKTGSIPPGATVWWRWVLTDIDGKTNTVPSESIVYTDTRFSWQVKKQADMDIYWHGQNEALVNELANEVQARLYRIQLNVTIPPERKPKVFVYTNTEELQGAVLFEQQWTGAMAFPEHNIVLTVVNDSNLEWAKRALPHEITHLTVGEAVFGPFGDIPGWLDEGLAQYSEGPMADDLKQVLDKAILDNKLISIQSLSSSFPTELSGAYLAYAESNSVVRYMIDTYGWEKMRLLISIFKEGSTYDKALQTVYSFDIDGLDTEWKASLKAN